MKYRSISNAGAATVAGFGKATCDFPNRLPLLGRWFEA